MNSTSKDAISRGYLYGVNGNHFGWFHKLELPEGFVDLTDLDDDEFNRYLRDHTIRTVGDEA